MGDIPKHNPSSPFMQCDYCKVIEFEPPMPAKVMIKLSPVHPVYNAIKWCSEADDYKWVCKEQEDTIEKLQKKCELLKNHIKYMPGGEGALEALDHFTETKTEESMVSK